MTTTRVLIGGGQGAVSDQTGPLAALTAAGPDYIAGDSLAEGSLPAMQRDRAADPALGYARGVGDYADALLPWVASGHRWITNAGGLNPVAAGRVVLDRARAAGLPGLRVATVTGDDLLAGDLGERSYLAHHAYLGARPVVRALEQGADVVVTGRVADAALFLGPLVHEFGWAWDDWDRLAAGAVVGHLLECSAQVAGGTYSGEWWKVIDPLRAGFPLAEVSADGSAVLTKPPGTAGAVTVDTVRHQLLYEVHDPSAYITPDVVVDLTSVHLEQVGPDRVAVSGVRGRPATGTYKAVGYTPAGWLGELQVTYSWPDASAKGRAALAYVRAAAKAAGVPVDEWLEEYIGAGALQPGVAGDDPPEVVARLAWRSPDPASAARVAPLAGALSLSGPPGLATQGIGRDRAPIPLYELHASLVDKAAVDAAVGIEVRGS